MEIITYQNFLCIVMNDDICVYTVKITAEYFQFEVDFGVCTWLVYATVVCKECISLCLDWEEYRLYIKHIAEP